MSIADHRNFELIGTLDRIIWRDDSDPSNGTSNGNGTSTAIIAALKDGTTIKGEIQPGELETGIQYRFLGRWENHHKYGRQFSFQTLTPDTPLTETGIVKYLATLATGVGQATAKKLWAKYGPDAVEILRSDPGRVASDGIMSLDVAQAAASDLLKNQALEKTKIELFGLFAGRGFSKHTLSACIQKWGVAAPTRIRKDPFLLLVADIPGAGFKRCDKLYCDLGLDRTRIKRQMFCAWYEISTASDQGGHTWHREPLIKRAIMQYVGLGEAKPDQALELGRRGGWFSVVTDPRGQPWVADASKAEAEANVASCIRAVIGGGNDDNERSLWPTPRDLDASVLSKHQMEKIAPILSSPVAVLAGTPGTGKTFCAAEIVRKVIKTWGQSSIAVCCPTGKAAVRITETMFRYGIDLQATTIHRLLQVTRNGHDGKGWAFAFNRNNPLPYQFYIMDETSMTDVPLMASFLQAMPPRAHVLFVGDPYQLPPVGNGAPLRDLIDSNVVPVALLTEIERQGKASLIVRACSAIKNGNGFQTAPRYEPEKGENLQHIECETPEAQLDALAKIIRAMQLSGRFDLRHDVQVLCAMNKRGGVSRERLNTMLQGMINPDVRVQSDTQTSLRVGDKIICLRNCLTTIYDRDMLKPAHDIKSYTVSTRGGLPAPAFLANGEIGEVVAIGDGMIAAEFPEKIVKFSAKKARRRAETDSEAMGQETVQEKDSEATEGSGGDFALAYAVTTHKYQGSEAPVVIVMIDDNAGYVTSREHVYTAISRASKLCILIGKKSTIEKQIRKVSIESRKTFLKELLRPELYKIERRTAPPPKPNPKSSATDSVSKIQKIMEEI